MAPHSSGWVSVRCVFLLLRGEEQVYEERITLWRSADMDEAVARAEREAEAYADEVADGAEVFSLMRVHAASPDEYLARFFSSERISPGDGS
jgi:hypothetical protein